MVCSLVTIDRHWSRLGADDHDFRQVANRSPAWTGWRRADRQHGFRSRAIDRGEPFRYGDQGAAQHGTKHRRRGPGAPFGLPNETSAHFKPETD